MGASGALVSGALVSAIAAIAGLLAIMAAASPANAQAQTEPAGRARAKPPALVRIAGLKADLKTVYGTGFLTGRDNPVILTSKFVVTDCLILLAGRENDGVLKPIERWMENTTMDAASLVPPEKWQVDNPQAMVNVGAPEKDRLETKLPIRALTAPLAGKPKETAGELDSNGLASFEEPLPLEFQGSPILRNDGKIIGLCGAGIWGNEARITMARELKENNVWAEVENRLSENELKALEEWFVLSKREENRKTTAEHTEAAFAPIIEKRKNVPPWISLVQTEKGAMIAATARLETAQTQVDWKGIGNPDAENLQTAIDALAEFGNAGQNLQEKAKDYETAMWGALQKSFPPQEATPKMKTIEGTTKPLRALGAQAVKLAAKSQSYLKNWAEGTHTQEMLDNVRAETSIYGKLKIQAAEAIQGPVD